MRISHSLIQATICICLSLILNNCKGPLEAVEKEFVQNKWSYTDSLTLSHAPRDLNAYYRLIFGFTVNEDYPFRNIYVKSRFGTSVQATKESITEFILADKDGKWYVSKSFFGSKYKFEVILLDSIQFKKLGTYQLSLRQYMRHDTLKGVLNAKIRLEKL